MSATDLSDNIYLAFILSALVEIPAYTVTIWIIDHWGRKPTLIASFMLCGIFCIVAAFTSGTLKLILSLIGKGFIYLSEKL